MIRPNDQLFSSNVGGGFCAWATTGEAVVSPGPVSDFVCCRTQVVCFCLKCVDMREHDEVSAVMIIRFIIAPVENIRIGARKKRVRVWIPKLSSRQPVGVE